MGVPDVGVSDIGVLAMDVKAKRRRSFRKAGASGAIPRGTQCAGRDFLEIVAPGRTCG
jgi:hypothetical protein